MAENKSCVVAHLDNLGRLSDLAARGRRIIWLLNTGGEEILKKKWRGCESILKPTYKAGYSRTQYG